MRLLVTGAAGMLGRDVVLAAGASGHEAIAVDLPELDITDPGAVERFLAAERAAAIVNCAAWTDVDGAEANPAVAETVNAGGAGTLARAAAAAGVRLVHLSTDYVFDGEGQRPYVESDPTGPRSVYGRTKLAGEEAVLASGGSRLVVRSSWLFGIGGRNFVETMLRLAGERGEVAVVHDQVGCPTYTGHLAQALVALAGGEQEGIRHLAGAGACSWLDFAVEIFGQAGVDCRVVATTTTELGRPAPRPAYSVLGTEHADVAPLPDWRDGLRAYLAERTATRAAA